MTVLERNVEEAVRHAEDLREMRAYLQGVLDTGLTEDDLMIVLRHVHESLVEMHEDRAADLILDCLDLVTGWCGPGMGIRARGTA